MSTSTESYKHQFAKELLAKWFRETACGLGYVGIAPVNIRSNREKTSHKGVWVEYPIAIGKDGTWHGMYTATGRGATWDEHDSRWADRPPTYDELIALEYRPYVIFDVAIQHKGYIHIAFEVVHKNPVDARKLERLREIQQANDLDGFTVYEIDAEWILRQVNPPKRLKCRQII